MIAQTLTFGTFNLAAVARRGSLSITAVPKEGREWTDLNSNRHITNTGWTYEVEVELNPLTYAQARSLYGQIKAQPKNLVFSFAGETSNITQSSMLEDITLEPTFVAALCQGGAKLTFIEAH